MSNITRELFFSVPIFYFDLDNSNEINLKLKNLIFDWKDKDKGVERSNVLGWHSKDDMHIRNHFNFFTDEINNIQNEIPLTEEYANNTELRVENMWANVNHKYSYNRFHTHPGSLWSGVYYVQSPPNCGSILFKLVDRDLYGTPTYEKDNIDRQTHQWQTIEYKPIEGRVILFPSWLGHEVQQNLTDVEGENGNRISISFNTIQKIKET